MLRKTGAILTRIWEPRVSGPKSHERTAAPGTLVEKRAQLGLCLGEATRALAISVFVG